MCNFYVLRLVIETPSIPYSNTGKHYLTINSHLITSFKSIVYNKTS